jgi:hypothetical protein
MTYSSLIKTQSRVLLERPSEHKNTGNLQPWGHRLNKGISNPSNGLILASKTIAIASENHVVIHGILDLDSTLGIVKVTLDIPVKVFEEGPLGKARKRSSLLCLSPAKVGITD